MRYITAEMISQYTTNPWFFKDVWYPVFGDKEMWVCKEEVKRLCDKNIYVCKWLVKLLPLECQEEYLRCYEENGYEDFVIEKFVQLYNKKLSKVDKIVEQAKK
jgi:hypothetical protein